MAETVRGDTTAGDSGSGSGILATSPRAKHPERELTEFHAHPKSAIWAKVIKNANIRLD